MSTPRLLLCAPASGGGKTTVTCALLQALMDRKVNPVAFKCGPDYIDPMFHSKVIGAKSRNLDLFFLGEDRTRSLLEHNSVGSGLALIEGVMGYYDGIAMSHEASAYHLAKATRTPAVLVVDGRGSALTLSAVVHGLKTFRPDSGIRGVILNWVSPMLYPRLKECIEAETGVTVYGFLPSLPDCALESRHLGLVTADEVAGLKEKLKKLAAQAEQTMDLDGLLALAASAPDLDAGPLDLPEPVEGTPVIAVARDKAFCFYYADGLELLEKLGARLVEFSPLEDQALPEGTCGLYLGGRLPGAAGRAAEPKYRHVGRHPGRDGGWPAHRGRVRRLPLPPRDAGRYQRNRLAHGGGDPRQGLEYRQAGPVRLCGPHRPDRRPAVSGGRRAARPRVPLLGQPAARRQLPGPEAVEQSWLGLRRSCAYAVRRFSPLSFLGQT